jgi:hypothetical protein
MPEAMRMSVALDHFIVPSRDAVKAAGQLGGLLGVRWSEHAAIGPFSPVFVNEGLTLDFQTTTRVFPIHHYCFRVHAGRVRRDPRADQGRRHSVPQRRDGADDNKVGDDSTGTSTGMNPTEHYWEMLTRSYAREDETREPRSTTRSEVRAIQVERRSSNSP